MAEIIKYWDNGDKLFLNTSTSNIEVTSDPNLTGTDRSMDVTIKLSNYDIQETITILQKAEDIEVTILGYGDTALGYSNTLFTPNPEDAGEYEIDMDDPWSIIPGTRYLGTYAPSNNLQYDNINDVVIEGLEFNNTEDWVNTLNITNSNNIIIRNCKFHSPDSIAIHLWNCTNVTVEDCEFESVHTAIRADTCQGIVFQYNDVLNIIGYMNGKELGGMAHFIKVYGKGNRVQYNACENIPGQSAPEDIISGYDSHGDPDDPISFIGNWIRGGGPSVTGCGINLGDWGGTYQLAEYNILVNPGWIGLGIIGGHNQTFRHNKVFGEELPHSGVATIMYNWYPEFSTFHNIVMENNKANFINRLGYQDLLWAPDPVGIPVVDLNDLYDPTLTKDILPTRILKRMG